MSRIGRQPIEVQEGIAVKVDGRSVVVSGQKGELLLNVPAGINVKIEDGRVIVGRENEQIKTRATHGTIRANIANMIEGVSKGFSKTLKVVGTGYKAVLKGEDLVLSVGFSHPLEFKPLPGIKFSVEGNDVFTVSGIDKVVVGQTADKIRGFRKPEPYKGKGIKYIDEVIRRKAGKAGKAGAAGGVA